MLPNVNIELGNGTLGTVSDTGDGIAALIVSGTGTVGLPLATPGVVHSLAEAEAKGITLVAQPSAYRHIKEFYDGYRLISGKEVAKLYIVMVLPSMLMADVVAPTTESIGRKLLEYAQGSIRLLGVTRNPQEGYVPNLTDGLDADSYGAAQSAQALAELMANKQAPLRVLVEGRSFDYGNVGDLVNLTTLGQNRVGIVLWSTKKDGSSSVGYTLGVKAALPVQRKLSRVRNGALGLPTAVIGNMSVEEIPAGIESLHDLGYITLRTYPTRSGYYFTGEPMACPATDDYCILSRGLVIDKAQRIAYNTFLDEVEEDIELDDNGQLISGYKSWLENKIEHAISSAMADNISGKPVFFIPDGQNILSNATTQVVLRITPKGYQSQIDVMLSFQNPALNN